MEKLASITIMTDDQADGATDVVKQLHVKPQNYSLLDVVQGNKDHPAHDLHQSSSSS